MSRVRATECDEAFSHTRPDGTSCFTAFDQAGIDDWTRRAENIRKYTVFYKKINKK